MATIVLQAAGGLLGGMLGPVGAAIGSAAGAMAGYAIDSALLGGSSHREGSRLTEQSLFEAEEGTPLPRIYGTMRTTGTLIWTTRFEEDATTTRDGAKGGSTTTEYSYYANAAFALCEGPISGIRRIWADGREIDQDAIEFRVYSGGEDQLQDPLIWERQGADNSPGYRGVAYVVFERLPLGDYGNRLPQFQFEVMRPVSTLNGRIRAVAMIPGATEYGYSPTPVTYEESEGETITVNRHNLQAPTDFVASLDELQALCPNLTTVALVVTWFGTDLRCGHCDILPGVTTRDDPGLSQPWQVSGVTRENAHLVSYHDGSAAYGGTPSDRSVMDAIAEIRGRGLKVALYPFIMMDVPVGNTLTDPYGNGPQAPYPWRGRVTCMPAPGQPGSVDKTSVARLQANAFCKGAIVTDFAPSGDTIAFSGASDDWGFRRLILHYAHLAAAAGGVDAFLIGSEMRGMSWLRDGDNAFPFVEQLCNLAGAVRSIVGPSVKLSYGADWTEYFGHQPADGSGDVFYHLDPLWSHTAIDAVAIDNYTPLSDWRDGDGRGVNPDGFATPNDLAGLRSQIAAGEGFEWFYASASDRTARIRTPITDGAYGKPWVFRYKDIVSWWSNQHVDRIGGVETGSPTGWVPQSKPIWFSELGCSATDKGPNQPNVFPDPKSSENFAPYFSSGGRDDLAQHNFLKAHYDRWAEGAPDFSLAANPVSAVYGGRMVDTSDIYLWAFDARPYPAFPQYSDVWADGGNWYLGHWLNGRLCGVTIGDLINGVLGDHGLQQANVERVEGAISGYLVSSPATVRATLEPFTDLFGLGCVEEGAALRFGVEGAQAAQDAAIEDFVVPDGGDVIERGRTASHDLPISATLSYRDIFRDHQTATSHASLGDTTVGGEASISVTGVIDPGIADALVQRWLQRQWASREQVTVSIRSSMIAAGETVSFPVLGDQAYVVTEVETGISQRISARRLASSAASAAAAHPMVPPTPPAVPGGPPYVLLVDLPLTPDAATVEGQLRVALRARPWRSQLAFASPESEGFERRASITAPATIGLLTAAVGAGGMEGRVDRGTVITVSLLEGALASVTRAQLLNGANTAAIRSTSGAWEIVQFEQATETAPSVWSLANVLRGQLGTDDAMRSGLPQAAPFVLLNEALFPAGLRAGEVGLSLNWRFGPVGYDFSSTYYAQQSVTGGVRAQLPLSPVHLRAARLPSGDVYLSWVRRSRIDADNWLSEDVPLGEAYERYRIEILDMDGVVRRSASAISPAWTYGHAEMIADFGIGAPVFDLRLSQFSASVGAGIPRQMRIDLT